MKMKLSTRLPSSLVLSLFAAFVCMHLSAADWPQWRGPDRNGISQEKGLLKSWPQQGPKLVWQVNDLGAGYGAPSVAAGRIYLIVNQGLENESVVALNSTDGAKIWSRQIGKVGNPKQNPNYPAARSTPTVIGDSIYALGSDGDLVCLDASNGEPRWTKSLRIEFGGKPAEWAYAESPLVDGERVICMPGGPGATIVALNRKKGQLLWKTGIPGANSANFTSAIVSGGIQPLHYIAMTAAGLVGIEPDTGKMHWHYEKTKSSIGSIPTPVTRKGIVYSGSNRVGGGAVGVSFENGQWKIEQLYFDTKLPTGIGGFLVVGDFLYGGAGPNFVCADFTSGEIKWSDRNAGPGSLCYADDRIYFYGENGTVLLIEPSSEGLLDRGRFTPPNTPAAATQMERSWTYPAISDGRLYIRNKDTLWSYDIRD